MKNNLFYLKHDQIERNELNLFPVTDDNVIPLQSQIELEGLLTPLTVIGPFENGKYRLISGECRWTAIGRLIEAGKWTEDIPCMVIHDDSMSTNMQQYRIISANTDNRTIPNEKLMEYTFKMWSCLKAAAADGEIEEEKITTIMAKALRFDVRMAQIYKQVFEQGSSKLVEHARNNDLGVRDSINIIRASSSKEEQDEILEEIEQGSTVKEAVEKRKPPKKETPKEEKPKMTDSQKLQVLDQMFDDKANNDAPWGSQYDDENDVDDDQLLRDLEAQVQETQSFSAQNKPDYSNPLNKEIIRYCDRLLNKDELTDDEYEVVNKMEEVVSRFLM